jgi:hypothetical protein
VGPADNFRLYYNQTIQPELRRLDRYRLRLLRMIFFSALIMLALVALLTYLDVFVLALIAMIPFGLHISYLAFKVRKFVQTFKPSVVRLILDFIDDGLLFGSLQYEAERMISPAKFLDSKIFVTSPAIYKGEDFIEGRIGDVEFELCELLVKEFSRVRERLDLVFRGVFIRARTFHPLSGALLVMPRRTLPDRSESIKEYVRMGGRCLDGTVRHQAFREIFTVYGPVDTRMQDVLPEELMDFMVETFRVRGNIYFSFSGHHIYAAISNPKDILEPLWFSSNISFELVREFYEDINMALFVIMAIDRSH